VLKRVMKMKGPLTALQLTEYTSIGMAILSMYRLRKRNGGQTYGTSRGEGRENGRETQVKRLAELFWNEEKTVSLPSVTTSRTERTPERIAGASELDPPQIR